MSAWRELWNICFPEDSEEYLEYYQEYKISKNEVFTTYREGVPVSMLQLNPYRIHLYGKEVPASYIVGVATRPEARHQGLMRDHLRHAARKEREKGRTFQYLMPADPAIYLPFDYRFWYTQERFEPHLPVEEDWFVDDWNFWSTMTDIQKLIALSWVNFLLYQNMDVYTARDAAYYDDLTAECNACGGDVMFVFRKERVIGAFAYFLEDETLTLLDAFCEDETVYRQLLGALKGKYQKVEILDARWCAGEGERYEKPIIMVRILDPIGFVSMLRSKTENAMTFALIDPFLPENDGCYEVVLGKEQCSARKIEASGELPVLSPGDLAEWIFQRLGSRICINEIV
ncbi:MAG: GNAT family N-acetyltransferase [Lachnospiraceae bacterium]|nr:GNAT family N-acetyltransferase [Lachnospiraceae bacterium]